MITRIAKHLTDLSPAGSARLDPRLGLVVRHEDVDMEAIALPAGASTCRDQIDGHRPYGSSRSSSPTYRYPKHGAPELPHLGSDARVDRRLPAVCEQFLGLVPV
jgi:hypothetical protein